MHCTIDLSTFRRGFENHGYSTKFSYDGLQSLFNYFEELEEDIGENIEFDPVAIACVYSEYDNAIEAMNDYTNIEEYGDIDEEDALNWLQHKTKVIKCDNGHIIIQDF